MSTSSDGEKGEIGHSQESADLFVTWTSQVPTRRRFAPLPGAKHKVLKYFAFEADDDRIENSTIAFCQVMNCSAKIAYSKNTTDLSKHLE